jgi:hypothetical protein
MLSGNVLKITLVTLCISLSYLGLQISYGQSEQQNFTAPKFGISMQYPADWTFVENVYEDRDYRSGDDSAYLGTFCPTSSLEELLGNPSCDSFGPVELKISTYKLKEGTTSKEFYDDEIVPHLDGAKDLVGRKNIEINNIKISGLAAIQTIDITGGGSMGKLLDAIGQETKTSKFINVYVANGITGYDIAAEVEDEKDYDTYLPTIQKMINSVILTTKGPIIQEED